MTASNEDDLDFEIDIDIDLPQTPETRNRAVHLANPYVLQLIEILRPYGLSGLSRGEALERAWRLRASTGVVMPRKFEHAMQAAYNAYCAESDVFRRRGAKETDALFFPVGGKGSGRWAVRVERAVPWLRKKNLLRRPLPAPSQRADSQP